jgi:hypothetical protein
VEQFATPSRFSRTRTVVVPVASPSDSRTDLPASTAHSPRGRTILPVHSGVSVLCGDSPGASPAPSCPFARRIHAEVVHVHTCQSAHMARLDSGIPSTTRCPSVGGGEGGPHADRLRSGLQDAASADFGRTAWRSLVCTSTSFYVSFVIVVVRTAPFKAIRPVVLTRQGPGSWRCRAMGLGRGHSRPIPIAAAFALWPPDKSDGDCRAEGRSAEGGKPRGTSA